MKMTDMRAKARAIFGPAIAEPMPKQPNGAKALQERANARPIPTYKVGGAVKKAMPPQPTAAEREADRKRREEYAKMKVTPENAAAIGRGNRSSGYKHGGKVQTSADTAKKLATEMGGMKKGGKPKKDGLAVMIAIGSPMKGMKKPVKKMNGGMASMIPAPDGPPAGPTSSGGSASNNSNLMDMYNATRGNAAMMSSRPGAVPSRKEAGMARMKAAADEAARKSKLIKSVRNAVGGSIGGMPISIPESRPRGFGSGPNDGGPVDPTRGDYSPERVAEANAAGAVPRTFRPMSEGPNTPIFSRSPMTMKKGGDAMKPVKKAQGGAGKVRKGMMTPEGVITHAMNKVRGK
jgi:hypothetical protein